QAEPRRRVPGTSSNRLGPSVADRAAVCRTRPLALARVQQLLPLAPLRAAMPLVDGLAILAPEAPLTQKAEGSLDRLANCHFSHSLTRSINCEFRAAQFFPKLLDWPILFRAL